MMSILITDDELELFGVAELSIDAADCPVSDMHMPLALADLAFVEEGNGKVRNGRESVSAASTLVSRTDSCHTHLRRG